MSKNLRVSFEGAPTHVLNQVYGNLKNRGSILKALKYFDGHAHERELFQVLNTTQDAAGNVSWKTATVERGPQKGTVTVALPMQSLRSQLATLVELGQIKRIGGERSARYALPDYAEQDGEAEEVEEAGNGFDDEPEDE